MSSDLGDDRSANDGERRFDPIVGSGPLFGRKRAAVERECVELAEAISELDRRLFEVIEKRRKLSDQLESRRKRLYRRLVDRGRAPGADGGVQLPPLPEDARFLWGRRLRSTCRAILSRLGQASLVELHATLHALGYGVASRTPVKALADALGYDADGGLVDRVRRGVYRFPPGASKPTRLWRGGPPIGPIPIPAPGT